MTIETLNSEKLGAAQKFENILRDLSKLPISFKYGEKIYMGLGKDFKEVKREICKDEALHKETTTVTLVLYDELEVSVKATIYKDYASHEWTVYLKNVSCRNSQNLSEVYCANMIFDKDPYLIMNNGDGVNNGSGPYSPYEENVDFKNNNVFEIYSETGRPTEKNFPYFNLRYGSGGVFMSVGWPAQWNAKFEKINDGSVLFTAGQKDIDTYLEPGESIRTPLMSFLYYDGTDIMRQRNLWRHWFIDCNMRKIDGELLKPALLGATSIIYQEMSRATEANQIEAIDKYLNNGIPLDYWWMDAGWYYKTGTESVDNWLPVGNWQVDTKRFPTKFKAISEHCHKHGMKTLLWFEPELVRIELDKLDEQGVHKEWLLNGGDWRLVDYGNPNFIDWVVERVTEIMTQGKISVYRQDWGHGNPAGDWKINDKPGRLGSTENHYAQGYLEFWDRLIANNPSIIIDTCASGGGRLDLETMRRSVPLHKTDLYYQDYNAKQGMHLNLFNWFPYYGTNETMENADIYNLRADYTAAIYVNFGGIFNDDFKWETVVKACQEWKKVSEFFYCDYYQLTNWSVSDCDWRAWEFCDGDSDKACIQVFRPENSDNDNMDLKLYGLKNGSLYNITTIENDDVCFISADKLMNEGLHVSLPKKCSSEIFILKRAKEGAK